MESELYCRLPQHWLADPSLCWHEWQSLIAGVLALIAAGVGACALRHQTRASANLYNRDVASKHRAAKTLTSAFISNLVNEKRRVFFHIVCTITAHRQGSTGELTDNFFLLEEVDHTIKTDLLNSLEKFTETLDNSKKSSDITELLRSLSDAELATKALVAKIASENSSDLNFAADILILYEKIGYLGTALAAYCDESADSNFPLTHDRDVSRHWALIKRKIEFNLSKSNADSHLHTLVSNKIAAFIATKTSPWITTNHQ
jgi:hypothetical protein